MVARQPPGSAIRETVGVLSVEKVGGGNSIGPIGTITPTINAEGWTANLAVSKFKKGGTLTLNPLTTPTATFNVTSQSYDTSGNATTLSRTVIGTIAKRQTTPNETSRVETIGGVLTVALSDYILSTDTVTLTALSGLLVDNGTGGGSTNSLSCTAATVKNKSTYAGDTPIVSWVTPPCQRVTAANFVAELAVAHRAGQAGKMVPTVKFIATGQTSNAVVTVTVNSMTASAQPSLTGYKIPVYSATIPTSSFTQGEDVYVDAIAYPFFGPTLQISVAGQAFPTANLTQLHFVCDKNSTYSGATAHVASTGNDSTGAINSTTNKYATIGAALAAIQAYHNTNLGRNNIDGGTVLLSNATYASFGPTNPATLTWGQHCWCSIGLDSGATQAGAIFNMADTTNRAIPINGGLEFNGITLSNVGNSAGAFSGQNGPQMTWFKGCILSGDNTCVAPFYQMGLMYFTNCHIYQMNNTLYPFSNNYQAAVLLVGCNVDTCNDAGGHLAYSAFGNTYNNGTIVSTPQAPVPSGLTAMPVQTHTFFMSNVILGMSGSTPSVTPWQVNAADVGTSPTLGVAFIQNVLERTDNPEVAPAAQLSSDTDGVQCTNTVSAYNTIAGARYNQMYLDHQAVSVTKRGVLRFNAMANYNIKRDTFNSPNGGTNAARVGNWSYSHFVGSTGNANQFGGVNGMVPGPDTWEGEYTGVMANNTGGFVSSTPGSFTVTNPYKYTLDCSAACYSGTGAGHGNYLPSVNTSLLKGLVPSGQAMLPIDIAGTARLNTGAGYAGAYEGPQ